MLNSDEKEKNILTDKLMDREYINSLRNSASLKEIVVGNKTFKKEYTSNDKSLMISDSSNKTLLNIKLVSNYVVTGLVAQEIIVFPSELIKNPSPKVRFGF